MRQHIAILAHSFFGRDSILDMILSGEKTIESRWTMRRCAPYGSVNTGDILLLRESSKPIIAVATVARAEFYELTPELVDSLRRQYGRAIGSDDPTAWQDTLAKRYGTLIWLTDVHAISPIEAPRSHGSGWMTLDTELYHESQCVS